MRAYSAFFFAVLTAAAGVVLPLCGAVTGLDTWAGRARHPAVVNPAVQADDGSVISLRGTWEFAAFRHGREMRDLRHYRNRDFWGRPSEVWKNVRPIQVPGCWEAQGVGDEGPAYTYQCREKEGFRLRHSHLGNGFYRRTVTVPDDWAGKRIWLKIGRLQTQGWVWIDDHPVAMTDEAHRALKWEVTDLVTPGRPFELKFEVDNTYPYRNSQCLSFHRWGGIVRDVELEATPGDCFIDDAWVRGDFDGRCAEAKVEVEGEQRNGSHSLRVTVEGETREIDIHSSPSPSTFTLEIPLGNFRPWSPEHPNLYTARVELVENGRVVQTRLERFGVRKLEVRGKEFYLNNRPFFVRGFGDDSVYPLTGCSPASREAHRRNLETARRAGFNFVRLHTHCEVPEYFEAADETGILVQPELSYNCDEPSCELFQFDPIRDAETLWKGFRRYPSFAVYSGGNEGTLGEASGKAFYRWVKEHDPDRLAIEQDGGTYFEGHRADKSDYASGPMSMWERGSFNPRAFVCHEYANLAVKGDARMEDDYTGVWLPRMTRAMRRANLAPAGLSDGWGDLLQDAQHDLQRFWGKRSVESARKDPFCDGYVFWTIVDFTHAQPKSNAVNCQGLFDPFWRPKPHGATPESFAVANAPTAILLDTENRARAYAEDPDPMLCCGSLRRLAIDETNRVYAAGERIPAEFILAHYGETDLADARLDWRLVAADGAVLAHGSHPLGTVTAGPARTVVRESIPVPDLTCPVKARLEASVTSANRPRQANDWAFWLFPRVFAERPVRTDGFVVADLGSPEAAAARRAGRNLLVVGNRRGKRDIFLGWWALDWRSPDRDLVQTGVAIRRHPLFRSFPYEPFLSPLLFRIIGQGTPLPVEGFEEKDFIAVGEGTADFRLHLAAKVRPDGGREVFVSGLDVFCGLPEASALLADIADYLK